jgi:hypothetical protein
MLDPVPWLFGGNWGSSLLAGAWFARPTVDRFWIGLEHPLEEYLENERNLEMICLSNSVEAGYLYPASCAEGVGRGLVQTQGRSDIFAPIIRAGPQ